MWLSMLLNIALFRKWSKVHPETDYCGDVHLTSEHMAQHSLINVLNYVKPDNEVESRISTSSTEDASIIELSADEKWIKDPCISIYKRIQEPDAYLLFQKSLNLY